jgi:hypothetical protein
MTDFFSSSRAAMMAEMRLAFAYSNPRAHMVITGITDSAGAQRVFDAALLLLPSGRTPLWTRHMLGVHEAERDRRRRR